MPNGAPWNALGGAPFEQMRSMRVSSGLNSLIYAIWIIDPAMVWGAVHFRDDAVLKYAFAFFAFLPVLGLLWGFVYFALKRPEMLRSERGALQERALGLIEKHGGPILDARALEVVMNPAPQRSLRDPQP